MRAASHHPAQILALIKETFARNDLPPLLKQHRLLEPLVWLRHNGVQLPARDEDQSWSKVRRLIETDVGKPWRVADIAAHLP